MRKFRPSLGFTLPEVLVVALILAIGASVSISLSTRELNRERINSAAVGLSGWLEEVRRAALKGNPCRVTITSMTSAPWGTVIATAEELPLAGGTARADRCQANNPFRLASELGSATVSIQAVTVSQMTFSTLGSVTPTTPVDKEWILSLGPPGGSNELSRCVRVRGMLGFIEVGNRNGGSCAYPSRY